MSDIVASISDINNVIHDVGILRLDLSSLSLEIGSLANKTTGIECKTIDEIKQINDVIYDRSDYNCSNINHKYLPPLNLITKVNKFDTKISKFDTIDNKIVMIQDELTAINTYINEEKNETFIVKFCIKSAIVVFAAYTIFKYFKH